MWINNVVTCVLLYNTLKIKHCLPIDVCKTTTMQCCCWLPARWQIWSWSFQNYMALHQHTTDLLIPYVTWPCTSKYNWSPDTVPNGAQPTTCWSASADSSALQTWRLRQTGFLCVQTDTLERFVGIYNTIRYSLNIKKYWKTFYLGVHISTEE